MKAKELQKQLTFKYEDFAKKCPEEMEKAYGEVDGLMEKPEVMSILSFETDCVMVRIAAQCPVGENWRIERDLRSRVKARFDAEGIVMPHYQKPVVK